MTYNGALVSISTSLALLTCYVPALISGNTRKLDSSVSRITGL
jgi:hypothetical protein